MTAVELPGSLADCPVLSAIELSGNFPATWQPGPTWDDGQRATADAGPNTLPDGGAPPSPPVPPPPPPDAGVDAGPPPPPTGGYS